MKSKTTMKKVIPDILYHYTTQPVLLSIVQHRAIWLSSQWHLNDSAEGEIFNRLARNYAHTLTVAENKINEVLASLDQFEFFVNCLTTHGDMLSQWRGYAGDGKGVSIGFNSKALKNIIKGSSIGLLYPVTYADETKDLSKDQLNKLHKTLISDGNKPSVDYLQTLGKERWAVKSKAFEEEDEFRLILTPHLNDSQVTFAGGEIASRKFRATETEIRNYYELSLSTIEPDDLIKEVVLGPKNASNLGVVKQMLASFGFKCVSVKRSVASYR